MIVGKVDAVADVDDVDIGLDWEALGGGTDKD